MFQNVAALLLSIRAAALPVDRRAALLSSVPVLLLWYRPTDK